ncbi:MAG: hypothetical protein GXP49_03615 [Deltaproteobacteria bacterium]|nr:hypothetical protein [Deltaproteobacteria bacterium]
MRDDFTPDRMAAWAGILLLVALGLLWLQGCGESRTRGKAFVNVCGPGQDVSQCRSFDNLRVNTAFFSREWSKFGSSGLAVFFELSLGEGGSAPQALVWLDMDLSTAGPEGKSVVSGDDLQAELLILDGPEHSRKLKGTGEFQVEKNNPGGRSPLIISGNLSLKFPDQNGDTWFVIGALMTDRQSAGEGQETDGQENMHGGYYYDDYCYDCYGCGGAYYDQDSNASADSSGCGGDETTTDDSGCQGDDMSGSNNSNYNSSYDSSGCSGDSSDSGCEGDAKAGSRPCKVHGHKHGRSMPGFLRILVPMLLIWAIRHGKRY